jgi:replicative DNA helicase
MEMREKLLANVDAEADIFACILQNPYGMDSIADLLKPEHFYRERHQALYSVMLSVYRQGRKCKLAVVWDELERRGNTDIVEGDLWAFQERAPSHPVLDHAAIVIRKATMRQLLEAAARITALAYEEEDDAVEQAEKLIYDIAMGAGSKPVATLRLALDRYVEHLEKRMADRKQGIAHGILTGFTALDHAIGGIQPGALYTLGALTGLGKTSWALNLAMHVVQHTRHALFFSLEMRERELMQRIIGAETIIDQSLLRDADIDEEQLQVIKARAEELRACDLKIDDSCYLLSDIKSKVRQIHAQKPLDLVVVDYLQLVKITSDGRRHETRAEEITELSHEMQRLAHKLDVAILVLVQLNRNVEHRQVKKPVLADISESGSIAKDSDVVLFLYALDEQRSRARDCLPYEVILNIAKDRNGREGEEVLQFNPRITKFKSITTGRGDSHEENAD